MPKIKSNSVYRFTLSNPEDGPEHVDDLMRQRYDGADVLVLGQGIALAEVEALDGSTFKAWLTELTDEAVTAPDRFASQRPKGAEVQGDPRLVACPNCNAQPGKPCTQPTDDSRKAVSWFHLAREGAARTRQ